MTAFDVVRWTFCTLAILLTTGRFLLRFYFSRRLQLDDLFNLLSLLCLLSYSALVEASLTIPPSAYTLWLQLYLAQVFLYWSSLYLVKATFLALCWYVFRPSPSFRKAWWAVAIFTFLSFWPIVLSQLWTCDGGPRYAVDPDACTEFLEEGISPILLAQAALDLALHAASDLMILVLPLPFIKAMHMSTVKRWSVAAVFAVIVVDIVMGILKNSAKLAFALGDGDVESNLVITQAMQQCEAAIAVMVCALPAYGVLLPVSRKRRSGDRVELRQSPGSPREMEEEGLRKSRSAQTLEVERAQMGKGSREVDAV